MKIKIGRRAPSALPAVTRPTIFYDTDLTGFGLKAPPTGALSYIVEYRPGAGGRSVSKRRMVIGTHKNLTPEEARNQASGINPVLTSNDLGRWFPNGPIWQVSDFM